MYSKMYLNGMTGASVDRWKNGWIEKRTLILYSLAKTGTTKKYVPNGTIRRIHVSYSNEDQPCTLYLSMENWRKSS